MRNSVLSSFIFSLLYLWKKVLCFLPRHSVCLCVCVCVCLCVCLSVITFAARWLDLATRCQVRSILFTRTWKCNTSQDDPFPFPFHMDHPDKITFWPVTSKSWTDSNQILPVCSLARGTAYISRILRSMDKSNFYGNFKRIRVSLKKSSTSYFYSICLKLTELIECYTKTIYIKYH